MRIYTRSEWGAKHADGFGPAPVPASSVWLHHSAGSAGKEDASFAEDARVVRSLEATGQRRFRGGISYTFVVTRSGRVFEGHSIGRRGAHTKGQNTTGRAICLTGNYETLAPTGKQIAAVAELLKHGQKSGWWVCPLITGGHQEAPGASTACPGRNLMSAIDDINRAAVTRSPARSTSENPQTGMPLVGPSTSTLAQAQAWARSKKAHPRFVDDILPAIYRAGMEQWRANGGRSVNPAIVAAQSAKETGWGRFSGVLSPDFHNTAGIKTGRGGGDYDPDAHQRFDSWDEGARAHWNHLAAYTGLALVGDPHPRYHTVSRMPWAGTITTVEQLGARWAPAGSYGTDIVRMVNELAGAAAPVPAPEPEPARESAPPRVISAPNPAALPLLRRGATGAAVRKLQTKLGVTADGIFGPITERAVREFQRKNSLAVDGIVGPLTWARLVR